jgi:hypothetical protein
MRKGPRTPFTSPQRGEVNGLWSRRSIQLVRVMRTGGATAIGLWAWK